MKTYVEWIFLFVLVEAVLSAVQFLLRKKEINPALRYVIIALKAVFAIAFAGLVMAGPVFLRPVQPLLVAAYAVLLPDAFGDLIYSLICTFSKKERKFSVSKVLSLVLGVLFFVYGTVNMQIVTPEYHQYTSSKITQTHKLVFVADLHVGSSQSFETTKKTIAGIKSENPDFIILGGDITDDYTTKEEMEETYRLFGEIGVPVYYVDGNHEVVQHEKYMKNGLHYSYDELEKAIRDNGIKILKDEFVEISPDLVLLGREDAAVPEQREASASLSNPSPEKFFLIADHQPVKIKEHLELGVDLQLSGHTHAGQLFPLKAFYSVISPVYGDYEYDGGAIMNVSAGACGWRVPFRTDAHCHYEVVELSPAK